MSTQRELFHDKAILSYFQNVVESDEVYEEPVVPQKSVKSDESVSGRRKPAPRVLPKCNICGDKGHGVHYGVVVCDSCKHFFHRAVRLGLQYRCNEQMNCVVHRRNRTNCPYCRFQKCLDKGMTTDSQKRPQNESAPAHVRKNQYVKMEPAQDLQYGYGTLEPVQEVQNEYNAWEHQRFPNGSGSWEPVPQFLAGPATSQPKELSQTEPDSWQPAQGFSTGHATQGPAQASLARHVKTEPVHDDGTFSYDIGREQQAVRQVEPKRKGLSRQELHAQFIAETVEMHERTCAQTENKMRNRIVQPFFFMMVSDPGQNFLNAWQFFIPKFMEEVNGAMKFFQGLRFIYEFPQNDRPVLMRKNMFILIFLRNYRALSNQGLVLRTGQLIDLELLRILYGNLADEMINVANDINGLELNDTELAVFMVIVMVQQLTEQYIIAHNDELSHNSNLFYEECRYLLGLKMSIASGDLSKFYGLMRVVRALHLIDEMHSKTINKVIKECSPFFNFPGLFLKIFKRRINNENQENPRPHQPQLVNQP